MEKIRTNNRQRIKAMAWLLPLLALMTACVEIEYMEVENPAYLRVFNNLNYEVKLENRFENIPFLTMLIDPVFDENNIPVSAAIVGDFLDERERYAAPYPVHSSNSISKRNPEYPGKENVLVGPILNGFDLSSWAQVPRGEHRIVFYFRPQNDIPFFSLDPKLRIKEQIAADTIIRLDEREVYTLHLLQKDFVTKENGIILRQEKFHKMPLADSLVYFNFYNYSAEGFRESDDALKPETKYSTLKYGLPNETNVYLSLFRYPQAKSIEVDKASTAIPGYFRTYVTSIRRDTDGDQVNPYFYYPLFAGEERGKEHITTNVFPFLTFFAPGIDPHAQITYTANINENMFAAMIFYKDGKENIPRPNSITGSYFPNMIVSTHSGAYNPRSFSTVNTIEIVNGKAYLTTVQRKYEPPVY